MTYRIASPVLALLMAGACSGRDATAPMTPGIQTSEQRVVASASSARSGTLHAVKYCAGFNGEAGSFCEITESNVKQIEVGSRIYYLDPVAVFTPAGSDVILDLPGPGNNTAFGHCAMNLETLRGLCTFSGGTGKFTWFEGSFVVSDPSDLSWDLNGAYSFGNNGKN
jgi:hypothetical protein